MSIVVSIDHYRRRRLVPPLVFVELQENQLSRNSAVAAAETVTVLNRCRLLLDYARSNGWPLGFVGARCGKRKRCGISWIEGFEPRRNDMVFERTDASCYTNREFADAMTVAGSVFVLAGFAGERTCLATVMDTARNGHQAGLIEDATTAGGLPGLSVAESHRAMVAIASQYATIVTARRWMEVAGTVQSQLEPTYDIGRP
ncbi:MAG: isochorismatase family protein [Alphaproteobacteria bacterium]|nr:isochorismatase family protein [Alphaproteobacteria bacterium]